MLKSTLYKHKKLKTEMRNYAYLRKRLPPIYVPHCVNNLITSFIMGTLLQELKYTYLKREIRFCNLVSHTF